MRNVRDDRFLDKFQMSGFDLSVLQLSPNEVHVWCIALEQPSTVLATLASLLSTDEQVRAAQFYFERDRRAFIACHGWLRVILGRYLAVDPQHLEFERALHGKPALVPQAGSTGLQFNLSHSGQMALYAIARQRELGIDLEYIRPMPDMEQIVARFFTPSEQAMFQTLPSDQRLAAFFRAWTCKEAYLKAIRAGLTRPLADFAVSLLPDEPPCLLYDVHDPHAVVRWSFHRFIPAAGYVATLCVDGHDWHLVYYDDGGTGGGSATCPTSITPGA